MLFDTTLNDDPTDYLFPGNIDCMGYARKGTVYNGENLQAGNFNEPESGLQEDGSYKYVYDFATNQANGKIACVCLVPHKAAGLGFRNRIKDKTYFETKGYWVGTKHDNESLTIKISEKAEDIIAVEGESIYTLCGTQDGYIQTKDMIKSGYLIIHKYRFPINTIGIFDKPKEFLNLEEEIEVAIPSEIVDKISSNAFVSCGYSDGVLRAVIDEGYGYKRYDAGAEINYIEIDFANNFQIQLKKFINNTGYPVEISVNNRIFLKDVLVLPVIKNNKFVLFTQSLKDNSDVKEAFYEDGMTNVAYKGSEKPLELNEYFVINQGKTAVNKKTATAYDMNHGTANEVNGMFGTGIAKLNEFMYIITNYYSYNTTKYTYITYIGINPFILMTKNNLSTPIQKTASQSMKVIYTLQEADE